jgi:CubicO group peptidase (beta-lactamase class C family)
MKVVLYIFLALVTIVVLFFVWFFTFYIKVPKIPLSPDMDRAKKIETIDEWFASLEQKGKFNGAVLISLDSIPVLMKGYGFTSPEKNKKIDEHSSFQLASVSKQFTAAAIMLLKHQQKLDFDDPVAKFIDNFPYQDVNIRHLLNQTSGIPDVYMELADKYQKEIKILTNQKVIDLLIQEKPKINSKPNENYSYSNTNYVILALLIEKISQKSHEAFMRSEIFEPLGMKNSRVWNLISMDNTFDNKTADMRRYRKGFKKLEPTFLDGVSGDGAVFTSIADMIIWDKFWYHNELMSPDVIKEAFLKPELNDGTTSSYGFGWIIDGEAMWHNGSWLGANTYIWRNPKSKTCIVILDNASSIFTESIIEELHKHIKQI